MAKKERQKKGNSSSTSEEIRKWDRAVTLLRERGRMALLLSEGLSEVIQDIHGAQELDVTQVVERLQEVIEKQTAEELHSVLPPAPPPKEAPQPREKAAPGLHMCHNTSLVEEDLLVAGIGSRKIGGQWLTLAIGVDITGNKTVAGVWEGASTDPECTKALTCDLHQRGLTAHRNVLFITDGSRILEGCLKNTWDQPWIAHCQYRLRNSVLELLPPEKKDEVQQQLRSCFASEYEAAKQGLKQLVSRLEADHPGAAAKLVHSQNQALTIHQLALPAPLCRHLKRAGMVRTAFTTGLRASRGGTSSKEKLLDGLKRVRTRRFSGYQDLPELARKLKDQGGSQ